MKNNKRGLSTVVTTLIIVLLVLVAVGIIWGVVNNLLDKGSDTVDSFGTCLNVDINAEGVAINETTLGSGDFDVYEVTMKRSPVGDGEFGAKVRFYTGDGIVSSAYDTVGDGSANLFGAFDVDTAKFTINTEDFAALSGKNYTKLEVLPYYLDEQGNEKLCTTPFEFNF
jgi:hypothetical protein